MEKLGTDPLLIGAQIINFGLLLFLLRRFLYKPVLKIIKDRQLKLEVLERESAILEQKKLEAEEKEVSLIKAAEKKAEEIIEKAKYLAEEERKATIAKADMAARNLLRNASLQIKNERDENKKETDQKILKLSLAIARKVTAELMTQKNRQKSAELAIKELRRLKLLDEI